MNVTNQPHEVAPGSIIHTDFRVDGHHGAFKTYTSERTTTPENAIGVFLFQGIVSTPKDPSARRIHEAIFANPSVKRVVTVGNNGMDIAGGVDYASRDQTAADRLLKVVRHYQDVGHVAVGISLGSQTVNDMLYNSMQAGTAPENIVGVVHLGPGIADPLRAKEKTDRLLRNVIDTTADYVLNHPFHYLFHPGDAYSGVIELGNALQRSHGSRQPIDHQHRMIEAGTPAEHVRTVAAHYPTAVRAGERDAVYDAGYWNGLADVVDLGVYAKRGHEVVFTPQEAIPMIYNGITAVLSARRPEQITPLLTTQIPPYTPSLPATA